MTACFLFVCALCAIEITRRRRLQRELRTVKARNVALATELHWLNHTHPLERD